METIGMGLTYIDQFSLIPIVGKNDFVPLKHNVLTLNGCKWMDFSKNFFLETPANGRRTL